MSKIALCPRCGEDLPSYFSRCPSCEEEQALLHRQKIYKCDICGKRGKDLRKNETVKQDFLCFDCYTDSLLRKNAPSTSISPSHLYNDIYSDLGRLIELTGSEESAMELSEHVKKLRSQEYAERKSAFYGDKDEI